MASWPNFYNVNLYLMCHLLGSLQRLGAPSALSLGYNLPWTWGQVKFVCLWHFISPIILFQYFLFLQKYIHNWYFMSHFSFQLTLAMKKRLILVGGGYQIILLGGGGGGEEVLTPMHTMSPTSLTNLPTVPLPSNLPYQVHPL